MGNIIARVALNAKQICVAIWTWVEARTGYERRQGGMVVCVMIFLFSGTLRGCTTTVPSRRPRGKHIAEHKDIFLAMEGDLVKTPDTNAMTASSMSKCGGNGVGIKQRFSIEDLLGSNRDKRKKKVLG